MFSLYIKLIFLFNLQYKSINAYSSKLGDDKDTDYSLWKATNRLKRPIIQSSLIGLENGKWARNNNQKAETFANQLAQTFQPNEQHGEQPACTEAAQESGEIPLVTPKEVEKEIKNIIDPGKAPGFDLITKEILKPLPKKASVKLTNLINAAF